MVVQDSEIIEMAEGVKRVIKPKEVKKKG